MAALRQKGKAEKGWQFVHPGRQPNSDTAKPPHGERHGRINHEFRMQFGHGMLEFHGLFTPEPVSTGEMSKFRHIWQFICFYIVYYIMFQLRKGVSPAR